MVGGIVINTEELKDKIRVDLVDESTKDHLSLYVELTPAARCIQDDDSMWIQNKWALWTPKTRPWRDYQLKRIGNTFVTPGNEVEKEVEVKL
jgi:hypothetical protein